MIKYTELRIYPNNKIPLVQAGFLQGDHNTVFTAMNCLIRSLERKKESYCYRVESENRNVSYHYSLTNDEFALYKKHIPELK